MEATRPELASVSPLLMVAGRLDALRRAATAIPSPLVPLKGIELAFGYYRSPIDRPMHDVDVLVTGNFAHAMRAAADVGFSRLGAGWSACAVIPPSSSFEIDLHRIALPPAMGALRTAAIVREAREDTATYGVRVLRACPEHLLLHLCANLVKDRLVKGDVFARDVAVLLPHVDPVRFAALAREARLRGTAFLALEQLAPTLAAALALSRLRRSQLRWLRAMIVRMFRFREVSYALARASCDGVVLPATTVLLSMARATRDRVRGTPSFMS